MWAGQSFVWGSWWGLTVYQTDNRSYTRTGSLNVLVYSRSHSFPREDGNSKDQAGRKQYHSRLHVGHLSCIQWGPFILWVPWFYLICKWQTSKGLKLGITSDLGFRIAVPHHLSDKTYNRWGSPLTWTHCTFLLHTQENTSECKWMRMICFSQTCLCHLNLLW